jgi:methionine biosynthesis protein MetW
MTVAKNKININFPLGGFVPRSDFAAMAEWIRPGATVLDLGCGDGALLAYLQQCRGISGYGVELDDSNVLACVERGVQVVQQDLEKGLAMFGAKTFDYVILSQTLQAMHNTESILREISRVGQEGIVSFPNFGHWFHVYSIAKGRMPVSKQMPYQWYDTPNIHLCTLNDFEALAAQLNLAVLHRATFHQGKPVHFLPNMRSTLALYHFKSESV